MKMKSPSALLMLCLSPLLVQCVAGGDISNLDLKIRSINNRLITMDQKVQEIDNKTADITEGNTIEQIQKKQAEMNDSLDRLQMEFLKVKGQLDESSYHAQNLRDENQQLKTSVDSKVADLEEQIMLLADQMNQTSESMTALQKSNQEAITQAQEAEVRAKEAELAAAKAAEEAAKKAAAAAAAAAKSTPSGRQQTKEIIPDQTKKKPSEAGAAETSPTPVAESGGSSQGPGREIYDRALSLFRASKFNDAYRTFTEYLDQYPQGKMAPNSRFWLGDCYYNQQEYELAILEYQKVIADFPNHAKAPAALLKQGLAFEKLKDKETAKIVYKKLLEEYPKSEQAGTAQSRIDSL